MDLYQLAYNSLLNLATEEGINASGKDEIFGCIFGRDSAITILKILSAHHKKPNPELLSICRQALITLVSLQGQEVNLESGEEPGKFIHEFRKEKYEHLIQGDKPWYVYPDGYLRNYDSIDSTPLALIAIYRYFEATKDDAFLLSCLPAVEKGLNWIITFGDIDKDHLIEYSLKEERQHGGLIVQSWTDSIESITRTDGSRPNYPIAPVEAQGYAWLALKLWGNYYQARSPLFSKKIIKFANKMKEQFNHSFLLKDRDYFYAAQALDGDKNPIGTITGNPMLALWASYKENGKTESIIEERFLSDFVLRAFQPDLFEDDAGIRTMSTTSPTFNPKVDSYHNGSFWPMLNGMIVEGLQNFGFFTEAQKLKKAALQPILHFGCPIELYVKTEEGYHEFESGNQRSCKEQAWSAAAILDMTCQEVVE